MRNAAPFGARFFYVGDWYLRLISNVNILSRPESRRIAPPGSACPFRRTKGAPFIVGTPLA
jgi:hypothetical protein